MKFRTLNGALNHRDLPRVEGSAAPDLEPAVFRVELDEDVLVLRLPRPALCPLAGRVDAQADIGLDALEGPLGQQVIDEDVLAALDDAPVLEDLPQLEVAVAPLGVVENDGAAELGLQRVDDLRLLRPAEV